MNQDPNDKELDRINNDTVNRDEASSGDNFNTTPDNQPEEITAPERTPQQEPAEQPKKSGEHHTNKAVWIVLVVLALLIGGGLGYIFGNNFATVNNSERDALQQQVTNLEADLQKANDKLDEAQSDTTDADKITELERENAALQQQVSDLEDQVADLEQQLEEAQRPSDNAPADQ